MMQSFRDQTACKHPAPRALPPKRTRLTPSTRASGAPRSEETMFKHFASSVGKRIRSNRTRLFLAAGAAILAAVAFTLASVAANDAILPRSNRVQASRPASTPAQANKTYTLYSGLWRTEIGGDHVQALRKFGRKENTFKSDSFILGGWHGNPCGCCVHARFRCRQ